MAIPPLFRPIPDHGSGYRGHDMFHEFSSSQSRGPRQSLEQNACAAFLCQELAALTVGQPPIDNDVHPSRAGIFEQIPSFQQIPRIQGFRRGGRYVA